MTATRRVVIVGASAAGLTTANTLRNRGYAGALTLIGDEPHVPYDRPPLSKQILSGSWVPKQAALCDQDHLGSLDADLLLGRAAVGVDLADRTVLLDGDQRVYFDQLVIATGVTPRRLPGDELAGVHVLRTVDDAVSLRAGLLRGPRVVVIGAGFLGAEVAAVARSLDLDVTLVDPLPTPLYRQLGAEIGTLVAQLHTDHGTTVRCGVGVRELTSSDGRVTGVALCDGTLLPADLVLVAIGSVPAVGWLDGCGLSLENGILCDEFCEAAPGVYAAGDVASWPNAHFGSRMRLEHRLNATEQAMTVAGNLLGARTPFAPVPYFWTDQYDMRIQVYGIIPGGAQPAVLDGDLASRRFVVGYGHKGRLVGVLGWNSPREVRTLRHLVVDRAVWPGLHHEPMQGGGVSQPARG